MKNYTITQAPHFERWFNKRPKSDQIRIMARLYRIEQGGNFGDSKWFGDIGELRFFFGAGYRIYYTIRAGKVVLLLCGGDKSSQKDDFKKARNILKEIED